MNRAPRPLRPRVAIAAAAILGVALAGCAPASDDSGAGSGERPDSLTLAIGGEPDDGFDPVMGWGRYGSPLFQSTLLTRGADLEVSGDLATEWSVSPDGLVWTLTLRDDAFFSNGDPVTSADVAYTFEEASRAGGLADLSMLASVESPDASTVVMRLKKAQSTFVNRLVSLGIVPSEAHGDDYARNPVGSGPYEFVAWEPGQQLIVERNEDYYGERPAFERLTFLFTDEDATLAALRAGQVDVAGVPSTMAGEDVPGTRVVAVPSLDNRALSLPFPADEGRTTASGAPIGNDVTSDVAVRRAINVAIDREALVAGVLDGFGSPAFSAVDEAPWFEPDAVVEDADPGEASSILEEAGWRDTDDDGVLNKGDVSAEFTLWYPAGDTVRGNLALAVADQLAPIGIEVSAKAGSWEQIEPRMHADPVLFGFGSHDPIELHNLLASSEGGVGWSNPGFYSNPDVDAHLEAALAAVDPAEATQQWQKAQLIAGPAEDASWAWLVNLDHTYYVPECLDLGAELIEPHGHGWPLTAGVTGWSWTC